MKSSFLVVFNEAFPADLIDAEFIDFPLIAANQKLRSMRCSSFVQGAGLMAELTPEGENQRRLGADGALYVHPHHISYVLRLSEPSQLGFVEQSAQNS
jgi:hypothetical protein